MKAASGRIVIAGGTGFLGLNLARHLADGGCEVILLSRHAPAPDPRWRFQAWDARSLGDWARSLDGAAALVNLTGRTVDCVKTPDHCDEILRSRVEATDVLGRAVRSVEQPPPVWVQMSTAHRYGDSPDRVCDETASFGYGLAPFVGQAWEDAFARAAMPQMRQVILRTSFVLGRRGGALRRLAAIARWLTNRESGRKSGSVGSGRQGISWLHEHDMNRLFARALSDDTMSGAYIATAPNPVSNEVFMRELRRALRIPLGLPAASWMVRLGAPLFLRTDPELALYGRYCVSARLRDEGFEFAFPAVGGALLDLLGPNAARLPRDAPRP
jgi:uncharacterized protein (TIGR01777 family)